MSAPDAWRDAGIMVYPPSELVRCEMTTEERLGELEKKVAEIWSSIGDLRVRQYQSPLLDGQNILINALERRGREYEERLDAQDKRIAAVEARFDAYLAGLPPVSRPPLDRVELAAKLADLPMTVDTLRFDASGSTLYLTKNAAERIVAWLAQEGALRP